MTRDAIWAFGGYSPVQVADIDSRMWPPRVFLHEPGVGAALGQS